MFPNCLLVYICDILYQSTERSANAYSKVVYFKEYHGTCTKNVVLFVSIFNACVEQGWKHMTFFFWTHAQIIFQLWPISHSHFALSPKPDINPFIHTHTHTCSFYLTAEFPQRVLCVCVILAHMHQKDCSMTECLCAYCSSPTPHSHILPTVQHTCIFIPPSLHIFFSLNNFLSNRGQFTPSLLSISLLLALSYSQFRAGGNGIYLSRHTHLLLQHTTRRNTQ